MMPITLDGKMSSVKIDSSTSDPKRLAQELSNILQSPDRPLQFVNRTNRFQLYPTQADFERMHRPKWIEGVTNFVSETIGEYRRDAGLDQSPYITLPLLDKFEHFWGRLASYAGSLIFSHVEEDALGLDWASLFVQGTPYMPTQMQVTDVLDFIDCLHQVDDRFGSMLRSRLYIRGMQGRTTELPGPWAHNVHYRVRTWEEGMFVGDKNIRIPYNERTSETFEVGPDGNIASFESIDDINPIMENVNEAAQRSYWNMLGVFLCAWYQFTTEDIAALYRQSGEPKTIVHNFLTRHKRASSQEADAVADLICDPLFGYVTEVEASPV